MSTALRTLLTTSDAEYRANADAMRALEATVKPAGD